MATPEQIQAIAAVATFLAACCAVWATFRAPKLAAEFAERLRAQSQTADEQRRYKLWIFTTLMQNRARIGSAEAVSALNAIDVIFSESTEVREAWRHFKAATAEQPSSSEKIIERYLSIVHAMARDMSLSGKITVSDIDSPYYPTLLGQMEEAAYWEAQDKLQRFKPQPPPPTQPQGSK
jgi:hypothetical protein